MIHFKSFIFLFLSLIHFEHNSLWKPHSIRRKAYGLFSFWRQHYKSSISDTATVKVITCQGHKFTLINKIDWWRHRFSQVTQICFTDQNWFCWCHQNFKSDLIIQLFLLSGLTCGSFKRIPSLDPKIKNDLYFYP